MFGYTYGESDKRNNSHEIQSLAVPGGGGGSGTPIISYSIYVYAVVKGMIFKQFNLG